MCLKGEIQAADQATTVSMAVINSVSRARAGRAFTYGGIPLV